MSRSPRRAAAAALGLLVFGIAAIVLSSAGRVPSAAVTSSLPAATQLEDPCAGQPFLKMTKVLHNNLGGKGPDKGPEGIVYEGLDTGAGESGGQILLVINATSKYQPDQASRNGFNKLYMTMNVKGGTSVKLVFKIVDKATRQPKKLHEMDFTFFDLDTAKDGEDTEYVKVRGFSEQARTKKTEVKVSGPDSDGFTTFTATTRGTGADNPQDPSLLTLQQRNRAIMLKFKNKDHFEAEIGCSAGPHPRYFTFVGRPSLTCGKVVGGKDSAIETKDDSGETVEKTTTPTTTKTPAAGSDDSQKCLFVIPVIKFCIPNPFA